MAHGRNTNTATENPDINSIMKKSNLFQMVLQNGSDTSGPDNMLYNKRLFYPKYVSSSSVVSLVVGDAIHTQSSCGQLEDR